MLGWCFFFYSLGARIPKWASTIPIQNFTDRKESKAAQPLPPTINCRLGDKSTYTTWAPPKKNVTFNYTRCLRAMVNYNPYIRWVVWLSLPTWKGRFQVVRLPFPNANSLIPARLGVRWYNTTRYTLKYWSQCNSCDGGCSAGGITLFSVAIHECWAKLWSLHRVRASLTTAVLSQMQSPYMKRLCIACYRWYTLRTPHICDFVQSVESRCRFWRCNGLKQWVN